MKEEKTKSPYQNSKKRGVETWDPWHGFEKQIVLGEKRDLTKKEGPTGWGEGGRKGSCNQAASWGESKIPKGKVWKRGMGKKKGASKN